jgi:xanthine/uracil permease
MSSVDGRELIVMFAAFVLPPLAFLLNLQLSYTLVLWACATGHVFVLHLISMGTLLLAASGGLIAWRDWQRSGRGWPDERAGSAPRGRFVSVIGILMSVLFSLVILAQWIPNLVLSPCER